MSVNPIERVALDAIEFIEDLTADPLLDSEDVEMRLEDVQAHAGIEAASLRKHLSAALEAEASEGERRGLELRRLAVVGKAFEDALRELPVGRRVGLTWLAVWMKARSGQTTTTIAEELSPEAQLSRAALIPEAPAREGELEAAAKAIFEQKGLHLSTGKAWGSAITADRYYCLQYAEAVLIAIGRLPPPPSQDRERDSQRGAK